MAVKIVIARNDDGKPERIEEIAEGHAFDISSGHLIIKNSTYNDAQNIAIYAPGDWMSAKIDK